MSSIGQSQVEATALHTLNQPHGTARRTNEKHEPAVPNTNTGKSYQMQNDKHTQTKMQAVPSQPWPSNNQNLASSPPVSPTNTRFTKNAIPRPNAIHTNVSGTRRKSSHGSSSWSPSLVDDLDENIVSPHTLLASHARKPFSSIGPNYRLAATMEENTLQPQQQTKWLSATSSSPNGLLSPLSAESSIEPSLNGSEQIKNPFGFQTVSYSLGSAKVQSKLVCTA